MAYLFELSAELGDNPDGVAGLIDCFNDVSWILSDGAEIQCRFEPNASNLWTGPDGNWWCRITPNDVSMTGSPRKVTSYEMLVELAQHMYGTLRACSGFRFALIGWEVAESIQIKDLLVKHNDADLPAGLVVSRDLWVQMGAPPEMLPFGPQSFWKPLQASQYRDLVRLFNH